MSSTAEDIEAKTGRAPAVKVGGVRVAARHRTTSEDQKNPPVEVDEEDQQVEEEQGDASGKEKSKPLTIYGTERDPSKDYPTEAIQHMQNKPVPTHQPTTKPASARPNIIQQPR